MKKKVRLLVCLLLAMLALPCRAEYGITPQGRLDMDGLRKAYTEGDFDPVRKALESFMKKNGKTATRNESVFAHIYLGVIYAADSSSGVRAENHFNALLDLAPNIELVDMFIPPKIQFLFDRVKQDFLRTQEYGKKYDALGNPLPEGTTAKAEPAPYGDADARTGKTGSVKPKRSGAQWAWWGVGAAAVVGAGVGVYYLTAVEEDAGSNRKVGGP
jgi:hypothetical protein